MAAELILLCSGNESRRLIGDGSSKSRLGGMSLWRSWALPVDVKRPEQIGGLLALPRCAFEALAARDLASSQKRDRLTDLKRRAGRNADC